MGKGKKIAGLVLGILSLCGSALNILPFAGIVVLILAIVGLVLAVSGQKQGKDGLGTAAFVISLIALIFAAVMFFSCGLCAICALCGTGAAGAAASGCAALGGNGEAEAIVKALAMIL